MRLKSILYFIKAILISKKQYFCFSPYLYLKRLVSILIEYRQFSKKFNQTIGDETRFLFCLDDKTSITPVEPTYFYQDTWLARKIFEIKPNTHVDVGSSVMTVGVLSQFVPVTMVDIRPLEVRLEGLSFIKGSILKLPFSDNSLETVSSMCVIEHIGLGRYGDPIDNMGSEKAAKELERVVKPGGYVMVSVPVDSHNYLYFNAHRSFTLFQVQQLFSSCEIIEEMYQYGMNCYPSYDATKGFGTGMFLLKKRFL